MRRKDFAHESRPINWSWRRKRDRAGVNGDDLAVARRGAKLAHYGTARGSGKLRIDEIHRHALRVAPTDCPRRIHQTEMNVRTAGTAAVANLAELCAGRHHLACRHEHGRSEERR